jgi:photosystem II stability/assembly factor-like uncharacterized protein
MSKRLLFLTILTALICSGVIQAQWRTERSDSKCNLNAISFSSLNSGWIVGDSGTILYKAEHRWIIAEKPTTENLNAIFMLCKNEGWAVGDQGTILHFTGDKWASYSSPTKNDLFSVCFKDSENGTAVGALGAVLIYKNGIWTVSKNSFRGDLFSVSYENDNTWISGGLECVSVPIIKNTDAKGGEMSDTYNNSASIYSMAILKQDNGWAAGSPSTLLHFNGRTWEKPALSFKFPSLKSVYFSDENMGICVGYEGTILTYSHNIWKKEDISTIQNLNGAVIVENTFYAVGNNGTILVKNPAKNVEQDILQELAGKIQLYPNPCNEYLNLVFSVKSEVNLFITIINANGQLVKDININVSDFNSRHKIFTGDLINGFYILNVSNDNIITSIRFLVNH